MKLQDLLSGGQMDDYHRQWSEFEGKFISQVPRRVHSSLPMIGQVFRYEDFPVFRAKILKCSVRRLNPYCEADIYLHPNFHPEHYLSVGEQMVHASMPFLIDDYFKYIITDRFSMSLPQEMYEKIHFDKNHPSVEVILNVRNGRTWFLGTADVSFYEDSDNRVLQTWHYEGKGELRPYVKCMEKLRKGEDVRDELVKKIEGQDRKHRHLIVPRKTLVTTKEELIEITRNGEIPLTKEEEEKFHDFFSLWD